MVASPQQLEVLQELINIGAGKGADILNQMLAAHIDLNIPAVKYVTCKELQSEFSDMYTEDVSIVSLGFKGEFSGSIELFFTDKFSRSMVQVINDDENYGDMSQHDYEELCEGTLTEVGNMVLNGVMGSIANMLEIHFDYILPVYEKKIFSDYVNTVYTADQHLLLANTQFHIKSQQIDGEILLYLTLGSFHTMFEIVEKKFFQ